MKKREIVIHKDIGDQYWHLLERGRAMTPQERYENLLKMQAEYRKIHNLPEPSKEKKIIKKDISWI